MEEIFEIRVGMKRKQMKREEMLRTIAAWAAIFADILKRSKKKSRIV